MTAPTQAASDAPATASQEVRPLPANACDSHIHIYNPDLIAAPAAPNPLASCTAQAYRQVRDSLGLQRAVVVTPAPHVTDNRVTLDAIEQLGTSQTRGVGVVFPDVSDGELQALHQGGIRGIRFTVAIAHTSIVRIDMIEPLAKRIASLGWHVQLHMTPAQIAENADMILRLPCTVVFDHLGRMAPMTETYEAARRVVHTRLQRGTGWAKLSGHYLAGGVDSAAPVATELLQAAPERLVWGSDWPHPTEMPTPPATTSTLAALHAWVPDSTLRARILVDNPAELYGF